MTPTDPTPLQERIARALAAYEGFDAEHLDHEFVVGEWYATAEALIPLVAAEVRKAQADALRGAARYFAGGLHCADMRATPEETVRELRRRADDIEKED